MKNKLSKITIKGKNSVLKVLLTILTTSMLTSCALDYFYTYQPDKTQKGKIVLLPVIPTNQTFVKLNDSIIIERKYAKSVTVENLPDGEYWVSYLSYDPGYKEKLKKTMHVKIENGNTVTDLVSVPTYSTGYWIYAGILTSTVYLLYLPMMMGN